jgi:hypothetical protein
MGDWECLILILPCLFGSIEGGGVDSAWDSPILFYHLNNNVGNKQIHEER